MKKLSHKSPFYSIFLLQLGIAAVICSLTSCTDSQGWQQASGMIWNTTYNIRWHGPASLRDSILTAIEPVDRSLSVFSDSSIVSRVNRQLATTVDTHFTTVYKECVRIHRLSAGMFDPTLAPAIEAWGFGKGHTPTADTLRCDSLRSITGLAKTSLKDGILTKEDIRIRFNLSALAKGYGCDLLADMFRRNGVEDFLIEIGGEIVCNGTSPRNKKWRIAIDRPVENALPGENMQTCIQLESGAVATSGNYRNFHESKDAEGKKSKHFGHTISPHTCRPVATDLLSVTVVAGNCMEADALATACMASGSREAMRICEAAGTPVLMILADSTVQMSHAFTPLLAK